jgi:transposase
MDQENNSLDLESTQPPKGWISSRCRFLDDDDTHTRYVLIRGEVSYAFNLSDKAEQRHVIVCLYRSGFATQRQLSQAFHVTERSIHNWLKRYSVEGMKGLSDRSRPGAPEKITGGLRDRIFALRSTRMKVSEIGKQLNIGLGSVCRVLYEKPQEMLDIFEPMDQESSEQSVRAIADGLGGGDCLRESSEILSGSCSGPGVDVGLVSGRERLNKDPLDRSTDRVLAVLGLLEDAEPIFGEGRVEQAGIFLAMATKAFSLYLLQAHEVYVTFGASFYGIRSVFSMLLLMALLRIKSAEALRDYNPGKLGYLLGLDRAPEVRTLRRKQHVLYTRGQSSLFMEKLTAARLHGSHEIARLYVDGHVKTYTGKFRIGQTFSSTRNRVVKGSTDYWVNDAFCQPLLVVGMGYNEGMTSALPGIVKDAQRLCRAHGQGRPVIIFDRGGYSATHFEELLSLDVDLLTYRRGEGTPVELACFREEKTVINGREYAFAPYEREVQLPVYEEVVRNGKRVRVKTERTVSLREILIRRDEQEITSVLTSIRRKPATEVAGWLFARWGQENFLKYMINEYALDHLCSYGVETLDASLDHPNPEYVHLQKDIAKQKENIAKICGKRVECLFGKDEKKALTALKRMKKGKTGIQVQSHLDRISKLRKLLAEMKPRVSVADYRQLKLESKRFHHVVKMTAYHVETELTNILRQVYPNANGDARTIIAALLRSSGTLQVEKERLVVTLEDQSSPIRTRMSQHICEVLNQHNACYPNTNLKLFFQTEGQNRKS